MAIIPLHLRDIVSSGFWGEFVNHIMQWSYMITDNRSLFVYIIHTVHKQIHTIHKQTHTIRLLLYVGIN